MSSEANLNTEQHTDYSLTPFFDLSPYLLCIAGFDGYFKKINPALIKLLGYSTEELYSKPINSFVHPDDQELTEQHRNNIRKGKSLLNFENRYLSKDGSVVWLSWHSIPVKKDQLVYAIAKNITPKKEHEEKRNQLLAELTQTNKRLKQLNYTTSHDLRTPVNNLLSVFSLMDIARVQDAETKEYIELLKTATGNLKETLDNYVDDLHHEETIRQNVSPLDIPEVFDSVRGSLGSLIKDSKTTFKLYFDEFQTITFNKTYLESIFLNLITNSIKYAHPDRDPVITVTTKIKEGRKQLVFSDNGQGFDSEKQKDKVFRFRQTFHNHKDSKGIGLYLVYNHITSLGGTISVESNINAGTTFTITFKE